MKKTAINYLYKAMGRRGLYLFHIYKHQEGIKAWRSQDVIFLHVPKAAGTSFNKAFGKKDIGHLPYKHLKMLAPLSYTNKKNYIIVVRDPIDRLMSTYKYAIKSNNDKGIGSLKWVAECENFQSFLELIEKKNLHEKHYFLRPAYDFISGIEGRSLILSFRHLDQAVRVIKSKFDKELSLNNENSTSSIKIESVDVDQKILGKIKNLYRRDYYLISLIDAQPDSYIYGIPEY